jgi:hypothetical protein
VLRPAGAFERVEDAFGVGQALELGEGGDAGRGRGLVAGPVHMAEERIATVDL